MKIDKISFGNQKSFDEMQNEQLVKLYKQYQETPFDYAIINYRENKEPKVKIYKQGFFQKILKKILKSGKGTK